QDQVAAELEVTAFTADLGADQNLRGVFFGGKVGGGAVAFQQAHMAVEHGAAYTYFEAQMFFQRHSQGIVSADQQGFAFAVFAVRTGQPVSQPLHTRVVSEQVIFGNRVGGYFSFGQNILRPYFRQRPWVEHPARESGQLSTGITEQDTTGSMLVQKFTNCWIIC